MPLVFPLNLNYFGQAMTTSTNMSKHLNQEINPHDEKTMDNMAVDPEMEAITLAIESGIKTAEYRITGAPVSQVRHSLCLRNGKPHAYYKSKTYRDGKVYSKNTVTVQHFKNNFLYVPENIPVKVKLTYFFPRPQRLKTKKSKPGNIFHTVKPDIDNLDKLYLDILSGISFKDDNQIAITDSKKVYSTFDYSNKTEGFIGVKIEVFALEKGDFERAVERYLPF